jgi:hypothetical protein
MKSDGDKHTSADRGAAAYGDHASNNTAITGPVGGDVVLLNVHPSPPPSGGRALDSGGSCSRPLRLWPETRIPSAEGFLQIFV